MNVSIKYETLPSNCLPVVDGISDMLIMLK